MRTDTRDRSTDDPEFVRRLASGIFCSLLLGPLSEVLVKDPEKVGRTVDLAAGLAIKSADRFMGQWVNHVKAWTDDGAPPGLRQV